SMRIQGSARRGFTLLEILVALVIFVSSIAIISRLVLLGLDNVDYAKLQGEGMLMVENRFAEIEAGMEDADAPPSQMSDPFPGWTADMTQETVGNFLYRITVTAKHTSGANVAMSRYFFDQDEAEQAAANQQQQSTTSGSSSTGSTGSSSGGGS